MPRADLPKSGRWRAVYLETRQHGSGRGGWNRARSRLAVIAQANGRVNELRRKPSTSPAAYSTRRRTGVCPLREGRSGAAARRPASLSVNLLAATPSLRSSVERLRAIPARSDPGRDRTKRPGRGARRVERGGLAIPRRLGVIVLSRFSLCHPRGQGRLPERLRSNHRISFGSVTSRA